MFPKLKDPGPYYNSIRVDVFFYLPEVSICASYLPAVGSVVKNPCANAGDEGLIPGSERSPEEGNGNFIPVFSPGKSHGQRNLVDYNTRGRKRVRHNLATKTTIKFGV